MQLITLNQICYYAFLEYKTHGHFLQNEYLVNDIFPDEKRMMQNFLSNPYIRDTLTRTLKTLCL